eukprot:scaffold320_cov362-Prasinococcus_capsulatus_cf.AAC.7
MLPSPAELLDSSGKPATHGMSVKTSATPHYRTRRFAVRRRRKNARIPRGLCCMAFLFVIGVLVRLGLEIQFHRRMSTAPGSVDEAWRMREQFYSSGAVATLQQLSNITSNMANSLVNEELAAVLSDLKKADAVMINTDNSFALAYSAEWEQDREEETLSLVPSQSSSLSPVPASPVMENIESVHGHVPREAVTLDLTRGSKALEGNVAAIAMESNQTSASSSLGRGVAPVSIENNAVKGVVDVHEGLNSTSAEDVVEPQISKLDLRTSTLTQGSDFSKQELDPGFMAQESQNSFIAGTSLVSEQISDGNGSVTDLRQTDDTLTASGRAGDANVLPTLVMADLNETYQSSLETISEGHLPRFTRPEAESARQNLSVSHHNLTSRGAESDLVRDEHVPPTSKVGGLPRFVRPETGVGDVNASLVTPNITSSNGVGSSSVDKDVVSPQILAMLNEHAMRAKRTNGTAQPGSSLASTRLEEVQIGNRTEGGHVASGVKPTTAIVLTPTYDNTSANSNDTANSPSTHAEQTHSREALEPPDAPALHIVTKQVDHTSTKSDVPTHATPRKSEPPHANKSGVSQDELDKKKLEAIDAICNVESANCSSYVVTLTGAKEGSRAYKHNMQQGVVYLPKVRGTWAGWWQSPNCLDMGICRAHTI